MEETTWFNCDLFGKMATGVGQYIRKGGVVHVTGRITTSEYNGKHYWSVAVGQVTLVSKAPEPQQQQQNGGHHPQPQMSGQQQYNQQMPTPNLDEIPF